MSWWSDDDDTDDDLADLAESAIRVRPNPKANRPRTKIRPAHEDAVLGRVLTVDRGRYRVLVDEETDNERLITATRARELRRTPIVTGDRPRVVGDLSGAPGTLARIISIQERSSVLRRSADDTDQVERIMVAGADQMLIVVAAADPEPRPRLVDRYLIAALDAGISPLLVVTKADLADPSKFLSHFTGLDNLRTFVSARDSTQASLDSADGALEGVPLEEIGQALVGHTTVFVGHSGVGKSTLVNALVPQAHRATGHVNTVTGRGRHTSSSTVWLRYRSPAGSGWVIDTPGVRSFGLGHVNQDNIAAAYSDLEPILSQCPRGCTHRLDAPDCMLNEALADDTVSAHQRQRIDSLQRLLETFADR